MSSWFDERSTPVLVLPYQVLVPSQYSSCVGAELGRTSQDGISLFIFMIYFNKTELLFNWKMGYECISTKLNRSFIGIWGPIGTDKCPVTNKLKIGVKTTVIFLFLF